MFLTLLALIVGTTLIVMSSGGIAKAGAQSCKSGYYFSEAKASCIKRVHVTLKNQDTNAAGGPQWGPPNKRNCAAASSEMDRSAALCRSYDARRTYNALTGEVTNGKVFQECAKCCRQLREGMARWKLCSQKNLAPRPDFATANRSAAAMNCPFRF